ncbi:hypothetical protein ZONE111904_19950 [Zobellia nedashkovskayae]
MFYLFFLIKKETKKSRLTDNFGTGLSVKKMYPKYIFSERASWRGGARSLYSRKQTNS